MGAAGCVLLGDPVYYKRFGFEPDTSLILADVPQEYFQALSFVNSIPCGQVTYHEAFNTNIKGPVTNESHLSPTPF
jgi:putative acetyltransferase